MGRRKVWVHIEGKRMLAECLTKKEASSRVLLEMMRKGSSEDDGAKESKII